MSNSIRIQLVGSQSIDGLLSLQHYINDDAELRGSARPQQPQVPDHALGGVVEVLAVTLGPGGAVAALASVLISWIRQQRSQISLQVTRPDGVQIELKAEKIKTADSSQLRELVGEAVKLLSTSE